MATRAKWLDEATVKKLEALYDDNWEVEEDYEKFEIIEKGEWTQDYKYQNMEVVVKFEDKFYQLCFSRSGSPFTDWDYNDPEGLEVTRHEKVVTKTVVEWLPAQTEEYEPATAKAPTN